MRIAVTPTIVQVSKRKYIVVLHPSNVGGVPFVSCIGVWKGMSFSSHYDAIQCIRENSEVINGHTFWKD